MAVTRNDVGMKGALMQTLRVCVRMEIYMTYKIISSLTLSALDRDVKKFLPEGYIPVGGVTYIPKHKINDVPNWEDTNYSMVEDVSKDRGFDGTEINLYTQVIFKKD